jgi:hypothetical protein
MTGWKTKAAGFASIAWGVVGYFLNLHDINSAADSVVTGLGILGIGHKIEKING